MQSVPVVIEGIELLLLPEKGVYWPDEKTLFVADTHFGKEATFRRLGLAVPQGSTLETLQTIGEMIDTCHATRLILLGDMFHARSSISQSIHQSLDTFFTEHIQLRFTLVAGNHDRSVGELFSHWPIELLESGARVGHVSISHFPEPPSVGSNLLLCGHIHPAYRSYSKTDSLGKLPCFWLSEQQLVLPAIGKFTGTKIIRPSKADRTWVIAGNQVVEVAPQSARRRKD